MDILNLSLEGVCVGFSYGLMALALVFIYKSTKVLNLAHGWLLCLFAYLGVYFVIWFPDLPFPLALIIVLIISILIGLIIERFLMRPLIGESTLSTMIVTLALGFILYAAILLFTQANPYKYPPLLPAGIWQWGEISLSYAYITVFFLCLFFFVGCSLFYRWTKLGVVLRAVAEDPLVASTSGVSVIGAYRFCWMVGCALAAVSGFIMASLHYNVIPELGELGIMKGLPVLLLGGLESIPGVAIGGIVIGVVELLAGRYLDPFVGGGLREITPFILMLLVLLFKPYGIFGEERIERV